MTEHGAVTIDGERYRTETFELEGVEYTLRELSVDEGDDIWDAAQEPIDPKKPEGATKLNIRLNNRMLLQKSIVAPAGITLEAIGKWTSRKYREVVSHFDSLNAPDTEEVPTPPAGSAGPTSPSGGESSPEA